MSESNKCSLNALPDEIILKILGNLTGLADKSKMGQVSRRFNRLANDKYWRRSIFISRQELEHCFSEERKGLLFLEALEKELSESARLETVVLLDEKNIGNSVFDMRQKYKYVKILKERFNNIRAYNGIFALHNGIQMTHFKFIFSLKNVNVDSSRMLRYHPPNTTGIEFKGKDSSILEKILELKGDSIRDVAFEGLITFSLLNSLSKCKDLRLLYLKGALNEYKIRKNTIPKIRCRKIDLTDLTYSSADANNQLIADLFYSAQLRNLYIPMQYMVGIENIWSATPTLSSLIIKVKPFDNVHSTPFNNFCDKLFIDLNRKSYPICSIFFHYIETRDNIRIIRSSLDRNMSNKNFILHKGSVIAKDKRIGNNSIQPKRPNLGDTRHFARFLDYRYF